MMKKLLFIPLLVVPLFACQPHSSKVEKFDIQDFFTDLESKNYRVHDEELTQIFYDENTLIYQSIGQVDTGVVKLQQGIFEIHMTSTGEYETHGMITSNTELDILDGCSNFHDITYLPSMYWIYNSKANNYSLSINSRTYNILRYTGFFASNDQNKIESVTLAKTNVHEYKMDVKYRSSVIETEKKSNYSIVLDKYQENKNEVLEEFVKTAVISPQTKWNEYQLSAFNTYGLTDVPFLNAYTLGIKLSFVTISAYASGGYACILYDCMSDVSKEQDIENELLELDYQKKAERVFYKESSIPNYNFNIQYQFISYEEIVKMVNNQEASEGDLLAYPNGYMQILFSYSFGEVDTTLEEINNVLNNSMSSPAISNESYISKVTQIDYKDGYNQEAMTNEEYIAMFEEIGREPGPIYDEMRSIYIYIEDMDNAVTLIDNYREALKSTEYLSEQDVNTSIKDLEYRCVEYYLLDENGAASSSVIDIYLYNSSSSSDFEYSGVLEIVLTKYTELGMALFYGE